MFKLTKVLQVTTIYVAMNPSLYSSAVYGCHPGDVAHNIVDQDELSELVDSFGQHLG
jgi:hypothetical protein